MSRRLASADHSPRRQPTSVADARHNPVADYEPALTGKLARNVACAGKLDAFMPQPTGGSELGSRRRHVSSSGQCRRVLCEPSTFSRCARAPDGSGLALGESTADRGDAHSANRGSFASTIRHPANDRRFQSRCKCNRAARSATGDDRRTRPRGQTAFERLMRLDSRSSVARASTRPAGMRATARCWSSTNATWVCG